MLDSFTLLGALQRFLDQRRVAVPMLTADPAVSLMLDWYRLVPLDRIAQTASGDALVYRHGGWSEGCATAYKFSLLRRATEKTEGGGDTDWFAGITLLFEPSRYAALAPFSTTSADWPSLEAFAQAIDDSPGFKALAGEQPLGVSLESGGLR